MTDFSAIDTIVSEAKERKSGVKNYIPFTRAEFDKLRADFGKPGWMPKDFKLLLMAIASGKLGLVVPVREKVA